MVHGPCSAFNSLSPCLKKGIAVKEMYPASIHQRKPVATDGYPNGHQQRKYEDGGQTATVKMKSDSVRRKKYCSHCSNIRYYCNVDDWWANSTFNAANPHRLTSQQKCLYQHQKEVQSSNTAGSKVLFWDFMITNMVSKAVRQNPQDLIGNKDLMGGLIVVLAGDFDKHYQWF
ncbi:hypothetical protein AVEN_96455-1 [Araneus ventricosus]|uniref:Uncharacterized protein n=1 Tax=Araneus ventricosus TaxID=182803 RepID=A0A4Y2XCU2_ARAVE|nr:hypothetical protein AVEN_96455-1 [Araneus ventricosus]